MVASIVPGEHCKYHLVISGDDCDIVSVLALLRAGGEGTAGDIIGTKAAQNPKNVAILRRCLHELYNELATVAETFDRMRKSQTLNQDAN